MNFRFAGLSLVLLAAAGCTPPVSEPFRPDLGDDVVPFEDDGAGLSVARAVVDAHVHDKGVRVDGPWDSFDFWTTAYGRSDLLGVSAAEPRREADGSAAIDRGNGLVERWTSVGDGALEQAWELRERPDSEGPIRLVVWVDGAGISGNDELTLTGAGGGSWTYGSLAAFDADGRALPGMLHGEGDTIVVTVDDTGARWPITIDPLLTTTWLAHTGTGGEGFGNAIAAGDFDNDGRDDVAVGAPFAASGDGRVYVYLTPIGTGVVAPTTLASPTAGGAFGTALAAERLAGADRLWVGAPGADVGVNVDSGLVYGYVGATGTPATVAGFTGVGAAGERMGSSIAVGVDFDGDAVKDLLIGAPAFNGSATHTGRAYLINGSTLALGLVVTPSGASVPANLGFGTSVAVGNFNGDGFGDLAVSGPATITPAANGRVTAYLGSSTALTTAPSVHQNLTTSTGFLFGQAIAVADFNGDGFDDLAAGAPNGLASTVGRAYWYRSAGAAGLPGANTGTADGPSAGSMFGAAMFVLRDDADPDSGNDIVVGAPQAVSGAGTASQYGPGQAAGGTGLGWGTVRTTLTGTTGAQLGAAVTSGDFNADGYTDVAVAGPGVSRVELHLGFRDGDGDGFVLGGDGTKPDCDDTNASIHNNTYYPDVDGDGFGGVGSTGIPGCVTPSGYSATNTDCNDGSNAIHPGAAEQCNGIDDNCDSSIDEGVKPTWYADADGDSYGNPGSSVLACIQPPAYVADDTDCNDASVGIHPGATEICDQVDDDCDGQIDEEGDFLTWYQDADGDDFGDAGSHVDACYAPDGYGSDATDCDDGNPDVHPNAAEVCNHIDDDCDTEIDEEGDFQSWYLDADHDNYGGTSAVFLCFPPTDYVDNPSDCDDGNAAINPAATEVCNHVDDDCDNVVDEAGDMTAWYADADNDGFGDPGVSVTLCFAPGGYVDDSADCDDGNAAVNPDATEICNHIDDDCDNVVDEAGDMTPWYADADNDGFGDPGVSVTLCFAPGGYVDDSADCDDGNAAVNPDATEVCNHIDDDCDNVVDEAGDMTPWYADADNDGFGDPAVTVTLCFSPAGYVADATDCDDGDVAVNPDATEVCNHIDDDCDNVVDEAGDMTPWYADADNDGFGDPGVSVTLCFAPGGYVDDSADCDDGNAAVNPDATEICNHIDDDCDTLIDEAGAMTAWYADADNDGFGDPGVSITQCFAPPGYVDDSTDCDDGDGAVNPDAAEICNHIDDDCDTVVDEDGDFESWYLDGDHDSYGGNTAVFQCFPPTDYVDNPSDCDDGNAAIHPDATEVCNHVDDDCDAAIDEAGDMTSWYADADTDGFGNPAVSVLLCFLPSGYVADSTDCNDANAAVNPDATEVCNHVDDDCDAAIDEAGDMTSWYADDDGDTFGDPAVSVLLCFVPSGYVGDSTDCDDDDANVNPDAAEVCNAIDDDCDTDVDEGTPDADGDGVCNALDFCEGDDASGDADGDGYCLDSDCDDGDTDVNPDGIEACDRVDSNCDGSLVDSFPNSDGDALPDCIDPDGSDGCGAPLLAGEYLTGDADTVVQPTLAYDHLGWAVAVGDFDGDGFGDLVASANGDDTGGPGSGAVYVFFGPVLDPVLFAADADVVLVGAPTEHAGISLAVADLDGRPGDDLVIGGSNVVRVVGGEDVAAGGLLDLTSAAISLFGSRDFGRAVASAGDVNGDGEPDLLVGAVHASRAWLFAGPLSGDLFAGVDEAARFVGLPDSAFGRAVAGPGDMDGDTLDDVVIGAPGDSTPSVSAGAAYVFAGDAAWTAGSATVLHVGDAAGVLYGRRRDRAGSALAAAGDLDGDGLADVWVGGKREGADNAGAVWGVPLVSSGRLDDEAWIRLDGPMPGDLAGTSLAAGDVNGDGDADLLIGGRTAVGEAPDAGAAWLAEGPFGSGVVPLASADAKVSGRDDFDNLGRGVAVGDLDGDGFDEVVVGAWNDSSFVAGAGSVLVFRGGHCP